MAVKVRLMRIGAKGRPFYRVVAVDERKKRTGSYLELLGTYNPLTTPKEIILKQDRIDAWVKNGAQLSDGFLRIIGKAKQRPARKPKKDHGGSEAAASPAVETPTEEAKPAEETAVEETSEVAAESPVENVESAPEEKNESAVEEVVAESTEDTKEEIPATEEKTEEEVKE